MKCFGISQKRIFSKGNSDGRLVLHHDDTLERTTNGSEKIRRKDSGLFASNGKESQREYRVPLLCFRHRNVRSDKGTGG